MKDFLKTTLAVICGLMIVTVVMSILGLGMLGAILASGSATPAIPRSGVLMVDMSKFALGEQSAEGDVLKSISGGNSAPVVGILDAAMAIDHATYDPTVKFIFLKTDGSLSTVAAHEELRAALADFRRESGKPVIAYVESPTTSTYYLASVADKVYMTSYDGAMTLINGVNTQILLLGDLLDRLGVNVQIIRHGKYKSAGEMFTRSSSSPENREQYTRLAESLWENISATIAESRGISVEELNAAIDGLKLRRPSDFMEAGLVDELMTREELNEKLAVFAMEDSYRDVKMISFTDYILAKNQPSKSSKEIAIIYADGDIVDGNDKTEIAGDRFARIIAGVREDPDVKAVVLRVNSGGGSVLASEKIKNELDLLKGEKPVIASYGNYAASGGYWISNNCDVIFSDASTITGSIGVFAAVPDLSGTLNDVLHVNLETISSNRHGDMYSGVRPLDREEYAYLTDYIEVIYDKFTDVVSEGRGIPKETVDAIGQGRIWSGVDALTINLVDSIGGLEDAVAYAAALAGDPEVGNWKIGAYPRPLSQLESLLMMLGSDSTTDLSSVIRSKAEKLSSPVIVARMDSEIRIK